jgi:hypothetical protein
LLSIPSISGNKLNCLIVFIWTTLVNELSKSNKWAIEVVINEIYQTNQPPFNVYFSDHTSSVTLPGNNGAD